MKALGVGINLQPHATKQLAQLGLLEALKQVSVEPQALLGDAAHPMYPRGGNGASQAIVDSIEITKQLSNSSSIKQALCNYEAIRRPITSDVVLNNRQAGQKQIFELIKEVCNEECNTQLYSCVTQDTLTEILQHYHKAAKASTTDVNQD